MSALTLVNSSSAFDVFYRERCRLLQPLLQCGDSDFFSIGREIEPAVASILLLVPISLCEL